MAKFILGLGLLAMACDPTVTQVSAAQYAIDDCRSTADCYAAAAEQCPYGFDVLSGGRSTHHAIAQSYGNTTVVTPVARSDLFVQCKAPVFCEQTACEYGFTCVQSRSYPGRNVCAAN
ncbi:MAG TPA: hypothetical protein VER96_36995 [Polyangiaceae bacterium]|nr:hypothetical protein [Polyangiaceae bacterium]